MIFGFVDFCFVVLDYYFLQLIVLLFSESDSSGKGFGDGPEGSGIRIGSGVGLGSGICGGPGSCSVSIAKVVCEKLVNASRAIMPKIN